MKSPTKIVLTMLSLMFLSSGTVMFSGCAEGMFWKSGYLSPWVRQKWSEEEQIAATLFTKRKEMRDMVSSAIAGNIDQQAQASEYLAKVVSTDPVLLLRIEATRLLGELSTDSAGQALLLAAKDREVQVRAAAVRSLERVGGPNAADQLARMARGDADTDVRISATAALGKFAGADVQATLSEMIRDPNPAMQLRAAESLASLTGQDFGTDIPAWQAFLDRNAPAMEEQSDTTRTVNKASDAMQRFR